MYEFAFCLMSCPMYINSSKFVLFMEQRVCILYFVTSSVFLHIKNACVCCKRAKADGDLSACPIEPNRPGWFLCRARARPRAGRTHSFLWRDGGQRGNAETLIGRHEPSTAIDPPRPLPRPLCVFLSALSVEHGF